MKIQKIQISKIKPDKDQPRKFIDPAAVDGLAKSYENQGLINPIEVDENNIIITGELRFRAAKKAGLTEIPCRILDIKPEDRLMRQLVENLHHYKMDDMDIAKALKKIYNQDVNQEELARQLGKTQQFVSEHLSLLEAPEELREKIEKKEIPFTFVRVLKATPEKYKKKMEKKIINDEIATRDGGLLVANALENYPDKASKLLEEEYGNSRQTEEKIREIVPDYSSTPVSDELEKVSNIVTKLGNIGISYERWLSKNSVDSLNEHQVKRAAEIIVNMKRAGERWLKD